MRLEAHMERVGKWWSVDIPALDAGPQGRPKKEAYAMAKDLVVMTPPTPFGRAPLSTARTGTLVSVLVRPVGVRRSKPRAGANSWPLP